MTETELLHDVTRLAAAKGLLVHHCTDSRRCDGHRGFPDLVIAGPKGLIFAELKAAGGETSADQDLWLWMLHEIDNRCSCECERRCSLDAVWCPADLESGRIEQALALLAC